MFCLGSGYIGGCAGIPSLLGRYGIDRFRPMMVASNVMRGGAYSGSVATSGLATQRLLDRPSSDDDASSRRQTQSCKGVL